MQKFDVVIIGAGPAGYAAAIRAWDFGKNVCLVERGRLGGAGVHQGVLFSKTMWELSKDYLIASREDRGYVAEQIRLDYHKVLHSTENAIEEKERQLQHQIDLMRHPTSEAPGRITFVSGSARFIDAHHVEVTNSLDGMTQCLQADFFLIATGSRPRLLDKVPVDGRRILTSDHLMSLKKFPRSLVILGAGVIGCEFATIFANFGQTKVNVIDRADRILPFEDEDIARVISTNLESKGVTIHHKAHLVDMKPAGEGVEYTIQHDTGGVETIRVDCALVSVGRVPNTDTLGLEKAGVEVNERGYVVHEDTLTSVPHIFAAGDVTYDVSLANVGEIEGRFAVERMFGDPPRPLCYENMSTIIFADPEIAAIGLNELQAQAQRIPYRVAVYSFSLVNRAIAMRSTEGFVKLLVTDDEEMKILGMRCLGVHASTTLESISLLIKHARSARDLAEVMHPHPAITEGLQECVRLLMGTSIYKPSLFPNELRLSRIGYVDEKNQPVKAAEAKPESNRIRRSRKK